MKKIFSLILLALFLNSFVFLSNVEAMKPASCTKALISCHNACGGGLFGELCAGGCGIGYLMC